MFEFARRFYLSVHSRKKAEKGSFLSNWSPKTACCVVSGSVHSVITFCEFIYDSVLPF